MDEYSVKLSGEFLKGEELKKNLRKFGWFSSVKKGEKFHSYSDGSIEKSIRNIPFDESSLTFKFIDKGNGELLNALEYLYLKKLFTPNFGIETIEVVSLMEREQGNGELSAKEISALANINAYYSWTVYNCCDE